MTHPQYRAYTLLETIQRSNAAANLEICCDSGDMNSYPGTGQTLFDVSGKASDFWLGSDNGATNDPLFYGIAGSRRRSAALSNPSNYCLTVKSQSTFLNSLHKAGSTFTFLSICNYTFNWAGDSFYTGFPGIQLASGSAPLLGYGPVCFIYDAAGGTVLNFQPTIVGVNGNLAVPGQWDDPWVVSFCAFDANQGIGTYCLNGLIEQQAKTLSGPSAANAGGPFQVDAFGNNNGLHSQLDTTSAFAFWSRHLTINEMQRLTRNLNAKYRWTARQ